MSWFYDWFNADEYLQVYKHRDEAEAISLLELIFTVLKKEEIKTVLDMACGSGRHAIQFARLGLDVTAVDLSENLLKEACRNAKTAAVDIEFIQSDIRKFNPSKKYDLAVNLFTSIGYFDDDEENLNVIKKAYNCLSANGFFILDYFNKNFLELNIVPTSVQKNGDQIVIQNRFIKDNRVIKEIIFKMKNGKSKSFFESVRLYSFKELENMIIKSGFTIKNVFGDYSGNEFVLESSPRVIIIAQR